MAKPKHREQSRTSSTAITTLNFGVRAMLQMSLWHLIRKWGSCYCWFSGITVRNAQEKDQNLRNGASRVPLCWWASCVFFSELQYRFLLLA